MIALGEHDLGTKSDNIINGKVGPSANVIFRKIKKFIIHEKYDKNFQGGASPYDIALIRVNESIPFFDVNDKTKSNVLPICLPWNRNDPGRELDSGNNNLKVLGWGRTTNDANYNCINLERFGAGDRIQQILDVPFISWRKCKEKAHFPAGFQVDLETQLCAGGEVG